MNQFCDMINYPIKYLDLLNKFDELRGRYYDAVRDARRVRERLEEATSRALPAKRKEKVGRTG